MTDICAQVRRDCARVAAQARAVRLNAAAIPDFTRLMLDKYPLVSELGTDVHLVSYDRETSAAYVLALDSINFGSGYFHLAAECGVALEYSAIAGGLKSAFSQGLLETPEKWADVSGDKLHGVFSIPKGRHARLDELTGLFAQHLREAGEIVVREYGGRVSNLLEAAGHSAPKLASFVAAWPGFHDIAPYGGTEVALFKRAQILAADMHLSLGGFSGMEELTCFADNMVPHVLRHAGILEYTPALAQRIDAGEMIEAQSTEEVEIRALAIHAVELMRAGAQKQGRNVTSVNLDHILWARGYEPELYALPRHRTFTASY